MVVINKKYNKTFIIANLGINHNGSVEIVKKLVDGAKFAGVDAIQLLKRDVKKNFNLNELNKQLNSPWGKTLLDQKLGLELNKDDFDEIDSYCKKKGIHWFASAYDISSKEFLNQYNLKYNKVTTKIISNIDLIKKIAAEKKYTFILVDREQIDKTKEVIKIFNEANCQFELMYFPGFLPIKKEEINLLMIPFLREKFNSKIGYVSNETGIITACAAIALGVNSIEKHITLDRTMYGSDQAASIELSDLYLFVKYIRTIEKSL